jgi:hypothetical protein
MAFSVSGSSWVPKSAYEHAVEMLTAINTLLVPLSITLVPSMSNVIWWVCLGLGALAAAYDNSLTAAKNSFSVSLCDDAQIENLLPVAGVTRIPGSYTTAVISFTGDGTGQTVPSGTHIRIKNQTARLVTSADCVVPASGTNTVTAVCDTIGPIIVLAQIAADTSSVETLPHIASMSIPADGITGSNQETTAQLRTRIINGRTSENCVDGLARALRSLSGISYAQAYFNPSYTSTLSLPGSITLEARTLYMVISGSSTEIAATYASLSMAPTHGSQSQNFVSASGQTLAVHYDNAGQTNVYVQVFIDQTKPYSTGYLAEIQNVILALAGSITIGQAITQEMIASALADFQYATINGVGVGLSSSPTGRTAVIPANNVGVFAAARITATLE